MIAWGTFHTEFTAILASLEQRRKRYLGYFYYGIFISIAAIAAAFLYGPRSMNAGYAAMHMEKQARTGDMVSLLYFVLLCCAFLILGPVYHYRGTRRSAALKSYRLHRFSLKDEAYSRLFKLFGEFEFAPRGGISLLETRNSTLFPQHEIYLPEDYVSGRLNDIVVKLCDANIARVKDHRRISIFKGLLIVIDIATLGVKLRDHFSGRTVIVSESQNLAEMMQRYEGMQKLPLPPPFEPVLEGFTSDMAEARAIITADMLESIGDLARQAKQLTRQAVHWDDRLAYAGNAFYEAVKDRLASIGKPKLPGETEDDAVRTVGLDLTKADPIDPTAPLNQQFEMEFFEDKLVLTIPCAFDLFEPNSLFESPLSEEDARFIYSLMQTLDRLTQHLCKVKP
jgi:hypothetical protein